MVCNALLEHVIDPTTALGAMLGLIRPGGFVYALTAMPSFHLHRYPRDYLRFHLDYFEDLPQYAVKRWALVNGC